MINKCTVFLWDFFFYSRKFTSAVCIGMWYWWVFLLHTCRWHIRLKPFVLAFLEVSTIKFSEISFWAGSYWTAEPSFKGQNWFDKASTDSTAEAESQIKAESYFNTANQNPWLPSTSYPFEVLCGSNGFSIAFGAPILKKKNAIFHPCMENTVRKERIELSDGLCDSNRSMVYEPNCLIKISAY